MTNFSPYAKYYKKANKKLSVQGVPTMPSLWKTIVAVVALLFTADAIACGDSMYRVGKGVSYRVYTAPLPGSVLVYGQSEGAKMLAEALAQSGHGVRYVESEAELESELSSGTYDVVIASVHDSERVEANRSGTSYLPVAANKLEAQVAKTSY